MLFPKLEPQPKIFARRKANRTGFLPCGLAAALPSLLLAGYSCQINDAEVLATTEPAPRQRITHYHDRGWSLPQDRLCEAPGATAVMAELCDGSQAVSLVRGSTEPGVSDTQLSADLRGMQAELFRLLYEMAPA